MSISSEILRISGNISDALDEISNKGVTIPSGSNSDDLASLIRQISGGDGYVWQDQDGYVHLSSEQGTQPIVDSLTVSGSGTYEAPTGHVYDSVTVPSGSASTPATSVTANPSISVNSSGLITATTSATQSVTPSVSAGWVASGTSGTVTVSGSNTSQLSTEAGKTVTPTTSEQTAVASGKYTTGDIKVAAMPSGTAGTPTATKGTVSNHSVTVTPSVTNETGYITGGTKTGSSVTVTASELVSGTSTITENGAGIDVTNLRTVDVSVSSLPPVTVDDNGKMLGVVNGEWAKTDVPKELPSITVADNDKVLGALGGYWIMKNIPKELPTVTSSDNGKRLGVQNGAWAKVDRELPSVTSSDNGKMLGVVNSVWTKTAVPKELPTITSGDNGKVLGIVNGGWNKTTVTSLLPSATTADNGKVLGVVNGTWDKMAVGGLPSVTTADNGKMLSVVNGAWAKSDAPYTKVGMQMVNDVYFQYEPDSNNHLASYDLDWRDLPGFYPKQLVVVYDDRTYTLPRVNEFGNGAYYGDDKFTYAPFFIALYCQGDTGAADVYVYAPESEIYYGHTISIYANDTSPSDDFKTAVQSSMGAVGPVETVIVPEQTIYLDTYAYLSGRVLETLPDAINVYFNGTNYLDVPKYDLYYYGDSAYVDYPFSITFDLGLRLWTIEVQDSDDYTFEITYYEQTVFPNDAFKQVVKASVDRGYEVEHFEILNTMDSEMWDYESGGAMCDIIIRDKPSTLPTKITAIYQDVGDPTSYELQLQHSDGYDFYGDRNFVTAPFWLDFTDLESRSVITAHAPASKRYYGCNLKVTAVGEPVVSDDFVRAVQKVLELLQN